MHTGYDPPAVAPGLSINALAAWGDKSQTLNPPLTMLPDLLAGIQIESEPAHISLAAAQHISHWGVIANDNYWAEELHAMVETINSEGMGHNVEELNDARNVNIKYLLEQVERDERKWKVSLYIRMMRAIITAGKLME
jgi:hypothetical protein